MVTAILPETKPQLKTPELDRFIDLFKRRPAENHADALSAGRTI